MIHNQTAWPHERAHEDETRPEAKRERALCKIVELMRLHEISHSEIECRKEPHIRHSALLVSSEAG